MIDSAGLYKRASEPLLASSPLQSDPAPPEGGEVLLETSSDLGTSSDQLVNFESSLEASNKAETDEYARLQLRIYLLTLIVTAFAASITAIVFDLFSAISLLVGGLSGLLYLRLLARSIGKLGKSSNSLGKIQLVVPVLLVLVVTKSPQLELLPSLLGFLLYKPSLIIQVLLESKT